MIETVSGNFAAAVISGSKNDKDKKSATAGNISGFGNDSFIPSPSREDKKPLRKSLHRYITFPHSEHLLIP
ncbi:MAG: hypothetical protein AB9903_00550 [Vulcanimicrobiota bacterium]